MSKGKRLEKLIKESEFGNPNKLSKASGVPYTTIKSFIERDLHKASIDSVLKIAKALNVSVETLAAEDEMAEIDYFDTHVSAGTPETAEPVTEYNAKKVSIPKHVYEKWKDKDLKCVKLNGESMNNVIPNGSLIGFKPINLANLKNGDIVLFNDDYDYSVKRFYNDKENERFIFKPDSSDMSFTDYIVEYENAGNLIIEGKVVMYLVDLD